MKTIGSHPGAGVFRSTVVIIIILICIFSFLVFTSRLSQQAEIVARDRVITDLKYALAMALYDFTIKGAQEDLKEFHEENPFIFLAIYRTLPRNYYGALRLIPESAEPGWYFDLSAKIVTFIDHDGKKSKYRMTYSEKEKGLKTLGISPYHI